MFLYLGGCDREVVKRSNPITDYRGYTTSVVGQVLEFLPHLLCIVFCEITFYSLLVLPFGCFDAPFGIGTSSSVEGAVSRPEMSCALKSAWTSFVIHAFLLGKVQARFFTVI